MMKLDYAGGEVFVSDSLCHALLDYSAAIARTGGSESLQIPVLTPDGVEGMAEVVIGPASQLLASPTDHPNVDLDDSQVVREIGERTVALGPSRATAFTAAEDHEDYDDAL